MWIIFAGTYSGANHSIKHSACCGCWEFSTYFTKICQWSGNGIHTLHVLCGTYFVDLVCHTNNWLLYARM